MNTTQSGYARYFGFGVCILLLLACGIFPNSELASVSTVTVTKTVKPTNTATPTATAGPAQLTLTEYARQAEGTRQVLVNTEVILMQNINATGTSRSFDATATMLAPLPSVSEKVEVQANVSWQDTGIQVRLGNAVKIKYLSGEWTIWVDADPLTDGIGQGGREETCRLMPEANLGGLIGKIDDNPPFFIGNGTIFYSEYNGTLFLSINDCPQFFNNGGALTVSVEIER